MILDEKTREQRVKNWNARKRAWAAKLAAAGNPKDIVIARKGIVEADSALERLGVKNKVKVVEEEAYKKRNIDPIVKSIKADREKRDSSASQKEDESVGAIGL